MAYLCGADETIAVLVKDAEGLDDLLLRVCVLHLARHHVQKLGEVNRSVAIRIHLRREAHGGIRKRPEYIMGRM